MRNAALPTLWSEDELLDGKRVRCLTMILRTAGCSWWLKTGGCTMCGYNAKASDTKISSRDVLNQFERAWETYDEQSIVKIYTSGSFLDDNEISPDIREKILSSAKGAGAKLLFESRPEFVTEESLRNCSRVHEDIELALGLESANDKVLEKSISKGFRFSDYLRAAELADSEGISVRTYLLLKPPSLTEREAVKDTMDSIVAAKKYSRVISINPVNVQKHTKLERLWRSWAYRPAWLWSLLEVLENADRGDSMLIASTVGAGNERGIHNCGQCDDDIIAAVERWNVTQDPASLKKCDCRCRENWERIKDIEGFSLAAADQERFFIR